MSYNISSNIICGSPFSLITNKNSPLKNYKPMICVEMLHMIACFFPKYIENNTNVI
ncbi:hypothetical protein Lalb_Chr15g0083571 [Lupinus albus]|uniref:Uncharacterized protein n=1 Tax=Lupinus albus TaxID=3870 RepID=A0A6A4PA67_LUPAL|nr:hypothetical protein Lalb_Chr15g0083571 [Lupinus albus]